MVKLKKITEVLIDVRESALTIDSKESWKKITKKYDMLIVGEKFNKISTIELGHSLKSTYNYEIANDEILELVPRACKELGMKTGEMRLLKEKDPRKIDAYSIDLF
ncbi:hypothetical protein QUF94_17530 [Peribacillus sp. NJ4]|uniref:hypothetical protein n=1 Tax=unclassified Peribacillus TaxID=2675266 RepID=UPI00259FFD6B|nr:MULTISPECIES: hypothetical protein [unclassified Peribacillus]MDM5213206.1 hypothetical protein [Peribacillus sp. NJ4]MDM5223619.1 hypothetical protein [Peribacillus sp. NJ11]